MPTNSPCCWPILSNPRTSASSTPWSAKRPWQALPAACRLSRHRETPACTEERLSPDQCSTRNAYPQKRRGNRHSFRRLFNPLDLSVFNVRVCLDDNHHVGGRRAGNLSKSWTAQFRGLFSRGYHKPRDLGKTSMHAEWRGHTRDEPTFLSASSAFIMSNALVKTGSDFPPPADIKINHASLTSPPWTGL